MAAGKASFALVLAVVCGLGASTAQATIVFNATYDDVVNHTGFGFDDPNLGATRRNTLNSVFHYINKTIDANGTFDLEVKESNDNPNGRFLATTRSRYFTAPNGFQSGFGFDHITTGIDPSSYPYDGDTQFNFGYTWNNSLGAPAYDEVDLFSVGLHEMGHALGISSEINKEGRSYVSGGNPGVFSTYDSHLELGDGTKLFNSDGEFIGTPADLVSNDVYFDGTFADAANGGDPVKVYDPFTWASGSSLSHLDDPNDVMYYYASLYGEEQRSYSDMDLGILQDLGYTLYSSTGPQPVPEPSSFALLALSALGIFGLIGLRRKV
jgi:hypothetical protein